MALQLAKVHPAAGLRPPQSANGQGEALQLRTLHSCPLPATQRRKLDRWYHKMVP